jgi:iron complex outermembrane receptor protein
VAFYAETLIPIFGPDTGIWGFHSLELDAGVRFEDWRNNATNVTVPKVALRWQPFDSQLTLRSTWGEGFLEPSMAQLYGPTLFAVGPTNFQGNTDAETLAEELPNRHIAPEHDRTWTGGFVYTPKSIPPQWGNLTFSVDLWDIERSGLIGSVAPQVIVDEFLGHVPGVIAITQPQKPRLGQRAVLFDPEDNFAGVASPLLNGGKQGARGLDLELQYQLQTQFGTFTSLTRTTYLEDFVFAFPGSKRAFHVAGRANNDFIEGTFFGNVIGGDGWMRWRGIENLDWTWKNWDLNWTVRYIGGYREEIFAKEIDGFEKLHFVNATWFNDASLSYSFIFEPPVEPQPVPGYSKGSKEVMTNKEGKPIESTAAYSMPCWKTVLNNTTLTAGVNDIFGEDPPPEFGFEHGNAFGYSSFLYDDLGRFVYGKITKKF